MVLSEVSVSERGLSVLPSFQWSKMNPVLAVAFITACGAWQVGVVSTSTAPIVESALCALKTNPGASTKLEK